MIKTFLRLVFMTLLLAGWGLAAVSLHVIRTPDRVALIPKQRLGFADTYVDARTWKLDDLQAHPALVRRVLDTGKADLFRYLTRANGGTAADQLGSIIGGRAAAPPAFTPLEKVKGLFGSVHRSTPDAPVADSGSDGTILPLDF